MTVDVEDLKRLAEEATSGPWEAADVSGWMVLAGPLKENRPGLVRGGRGTVVNVDDLDFDEDEQGANARFIAAANPAAVLALLERVRRLEEALRTIARWDHNTFPRVPDRQNPGETISYGFAYGSNGERDFMRNIALKALEP